MVIGFTERRRTVSEGLFPGVEEFPLQIDVATLRMSEREHRMLYRLLSGATATVVSFAFVGNLDYDARIGSVQTDPIEIGDFVLPGETVISPLPTEIRNDFLIEAEECYSLRIFPIVIPGLREVFMCNDDDTNPTNYFCTHTICIQDDDGKVMHIK